MIKGKWCVCFFMCSDVVGVLVVEDEAITALDLKYSLLDLGYSVVGVVDTGRDAISVARNCCPSVVLMDIKLKGDMEGSDAAWVICELGIPVVLCLLIVMLIACLSLAGVSLLLSYPSLLILKS